LEFSEETHKQGVLFMLHSIEEEQQQQQNKNLYQKELSFNTEGRIKTFLDKQL
jgi:hypothetical protein